ncbi:MAG: transcription factor [Planctomycetes bacterium]|nr:transcription factor [Planctomycetota bacterium]
MQLLGPSVTSAHAGNVKARLLEIDAGLFVRNFDRAPFLIRHDLCDHPLFSLPRLLKLAATLPASLVEYNAGELPLTQDPRLTPRNGLSVEDTICRIAECRSWMVLKNVEMDPQYGELLRECLDEVRVHCEPRWPGMQQPEGFIFLTSPGSVTPYHMDPEHNFLMQIRGSKTIHQFNGRDREVLSEQELEEYLSGGHRNLTFKEEFRSHSWVFELQPGLGLHFPATFPHYVQNGPEVSVSFSITFRTPDLERRHMVHQFNARMRQRGWSPAPVGRHPCRDAVKCFLFRLGRRMRRMLGRTGSPEHGY